MSNVVNTSFRDIMGLKLTKGEQEWHIKFNRLIDIVAGNVGLYSAVSYEEAVRHGFIGELDDWHTFKTYINVTSKDLRLGTGITYEEAKKYGFKGTEDQFEEFLLKFRDISLKDKYSQYIHDNTGVGPGFGGSGVNFTNDPLKATNQGIWFIYTLEEDD